MAQIVWHKPILIQCARPPRKSTTMQALAARQSKDVDRPAELVPVGSHAN